MGDEDHVNNIFQVFRRWNWYESSPIVRDDVAVVLERVGKIDNATSNAFFRQVDTDRDGNISYPDLARWFLAHGNLRNSRLLHQCKCPDAHRLTDFKLEVDGWCCEECGEDLKISEEALRCNECGGVAWCTSCIVQQLDIFVLEKGFLGAIQAVGKKVVTMSSATVRADDRSTASTRADDSSTASSSDRQADVASSPAHESGDAVPDNFDIVRSKSSRRSLASLDILNEGKGTPAEEQYIQDLITQLACKRADAQLEAIEGLGCLVKDSRVAAAVSVHITKLIAPLEKSAEENPVTLELLGFLRRLADYGQAELVGLHAYAILPCLAKGEIVVARKAAVLCSSIAREGSATTLTRFVPNLVDCCERLRFRITAPLEALKEIAEAGEGAIVVPAAQRLQSRLLSMNSRNRGAVCNLISATCRGGGGDAICRSIMKESPGGKEDGETEDAEDDSLLRVLLLIVRDEEEEDVKLSAAQALQSIVLFSEQVITVLQSHHSLLMFNCLGTLRDKRQYEIREARKIVTEIFRMDAKSSNRIADGKVIVRTEDDDDDSPELCCICCQVGLRCQLGGPKSLPCGHTFHAQCIGDWFTWETDCGRGRTCPLCRTIAPEDPEKHTSPTSTQNAGRRTLDRQNSVARLRSAVIAARAEAT